ncbi:MAG: hypothetical protein ACYC1U_04250 [Candidatus Aquicultorales bacterium]
MISKKTIVLMVIAIGILLPVVLPPTPAIVIQPEFSGTLLLKPEIVQTFHAEGTITGLGMDFSFERRRSKGTITCQLLEVSITGGPASEWPRKILAERTVDIDYLPRRGHWIFRFGPVEAKPKKTYAVLLKSDLEGGDGMVLTGFYRFYEEGLLYQGNQQQFGYSLVFRVYGAPSLADQYHQLATSPFQPLISAHWILGFFGLFLAASGLLMAHIIKDGWLDEAKRA